MKNNHSNTATEIVYLRLWVIVLAIAESVCVSYFETTNRIYFIDPWLLVVHSDGHDVIFSILTEQLRVCVCARACVRE